jgi:hypothetical protein
MSASGRKPTLANGWSRPITDRQRIAKSNLSKAGPASNRTISKYTGTLDKAAELGVLLVAPFARIRAV